MPLYIPLDETASTKRIFVAATSTDTVEGGMVLKEDVSQSTIQDRATKVTQCDFDNINARTYIVDARSAGAGDGEEIVVWPVDDMLLGGLEVRSDETVASGDYLGCKVGSYYATVGAVMDGKPFAQALEAGTPGSGGSAAVECNVGPYSEFADGYATSHQKMITDGTNFDADQYLLTVVDGGTDNAHVFGFAGTGLWLVTTNDASGDNVNFEHKGIALSLASTKNAYVKFEGVTIADVSESNVILGLAPYGSNSSDWYAANSAAGPDDFIGWRLDNDGNLDTRMAKNATQTNSNGDTGVDWADGETYDLHFAKLGSSVYFWHKKSTASSPTLIDTYTANIPDDVTLTVGGQHETANAAAETISFKRLVTIGARA